MYIKANLIPCQSTITISSFHFNVDRLLQQRRLGERAPYTTPLKILQSSRSSVSKCQEFFHPEWQETSYFHLCPLKTPRNQLLHLIARVLTQWGRGCWMRSRQKSVSGFFRSKTILPSREPHCPSIDIIFPG